MVQYREAAVLGRRNRWSRVARLKSFDWRGPAAIALTSAVVMCLLTGVGVTSQIVLPIRQEAARAPAIGKPENTVDLFFFGRTEQPCGQALTFKTDPSIAPAIAQSEVVRVAPTQSSRRYFNARVEVAGDVVRLVPDQVCEGGSFKPGVIETGSPPTTILSRLISGVQGEQGA
ncbi:MAG: hypothetical protein QM608_19580 [Caulobacter sp.]